MPSEKIAAAGFSSRAELENYVRNKIGLTPEPKPDIEIFGTRAELAILKLSDRTIFWGIKCVITDTPTEPTPQGARDKPERGELGEFGINGKNKKPPQ